MNSISVNKFRDNLKSFVEQVVTEHAPLKVTLYVLQNNDLMKQIAASAATNEKDSGYRPTAGELDEITGI